MDQRSVGCDLKIGVQQINIAFSTDPVPCRSNGKPNPFCPARSEDLDGIVDNVSVAANELSESMSGTSLIGTVSSVAKSAASIRGLFQENDPETRAAKKGEKRAARSRKRKED